MNTFKKIAYAVAPVATFLGLYGFASADYTTSTVATAFSSSLTAIVDAIIGVIVSFLTTNLPIIVVLGVSISFVFYLIHLARRAGHGR